MRAHDGPVYMRIGGPLIPNLFDQAPFVIGKGRRIREGPAATVVTTGTVTAEAIQAVDQITQDGAGLDLIGMPIVEPADAELIASSAARTGLVITVEERFIRGGLSAAIAEVLAPFAVRQVAIGLPYQHIVTGTDSGLLRHYRLDAAAS
ncbi:transketolase C-terminal domain-containing protein [Phycicoccus avicenniae]